MKTTDGKLWMGTENGVSIFDLRTLKTLRLQSNRGDQFAISNKSVRCIFADNDGIVWIGTDQGGIYKYDPHLPIFNLQGYNPNAVNGLLSPVVTAFAEANEKVYVGTDGGIQLFDPKCQSFAPVKRTDGTPVNVRFIKTTYILR